MADNPLSDERKKQLDNLANLGALLGIQDADTLQDIGEFLTIPEPLFPPLFDVLARNFTTGKDRLVASGKTREKAEFILTQYAAIHRQGAEVFRAVPSPWIEGGEL